MANIKRYEVTVDYATCVRVLVDATNEMEASEAAYAYLNTPKGALDMLSRVTERIEIDREYAGEFEVAYVEPSDAIGSDVISASDYLED